MPFIALVVVAVVAGGGSVYLAATLRERSYAVAAALAGSAIVLFSHGVLYADFYGDDAYITLRYARNLADGIGPVWNPGERVEGYSDFAWMGILAGMHRIGIDLVDASLLLSYLSLGAVLLLMWRMWQLWSDDGAHEAATGAQGADAHASPAVLAIAALGVALNESIAWWGFSGLETPLAAALFIGTAYLWMLEARGAALPWSAVAASAAAMTRPEFLPLAFVTLAFTVALAVRDRDERSVRRAVLWVAVFGLTFGAYWVWRYTYYGYVFPNTYYVKSSFSEPVLERGIDYALDFGVPYLFVPMIGGLVVFALSASARLRRDGLYMLCMAGVWIAVVIVEGGDAFRHGRFFAPVVPLLYLGGVAGLAMLLGRASFTRQQIYAVAGVVAALAGLALVRLTVDTTVVDDRRAMEHRRDLGLYFREQLPDGYVVAVFAAGALPYYYEGPSLDIFGLTDETIAHTDVPNFGEGIQNHEKYNIDYTLDVVRPEIIVVSDASLAPITREQLEIRGPLEALNELYADPRTWERYRLAAVSDGTLWYSFLQLEETLDEFRPDYVAPARDVNVRDAPSR